MTRHKPNRPYTRSCPTPIVPAIEFHLPCYTSKRPRIHRVFVFLCSFAIGLGGSGWTRSHDISVISNRIQPRYRFLTPTSLVDQDAHRYYFCKYSNEYLAAPASGASEYVELFNSNPFDVDLSDWQIDDIAGGSSPYSIPLDTFIPAQGFYLALRDLGLNNSGDTVRLIAPDGYVELFNHQSLSHFTFLYHKNEHLCYSVAND